MTNGDTLRDLGANVATNSGRARRDPLVGTSCTRANTRLTVMPRGSPCPANLHESSRAFKPSSYNDGRRARFILKTSHPSYHSSVRSTMKGETGC